jgi:hypothetical protein
MPAALNSIVYRPIDVWPGELTRSRKPSQFSAEFRATLRLLSDEVDHLTDPKFDTLIVVQLAVDEGQIRKDETGLLAHAQTKHPGVIVSFEADQGPLRFSCDRFSDGWNRKAGWRDNLRAVALALEALRKIDRYGIGSGREQYVGFNALPPGQPMAMGAGMTIEEAAALLAEHAMPGEGGRDPVGLAERLVNGEGIQLAYRVAAKRHHPDAGGDAELFRRLTEARDLLLR